MSSLKSIQKRVTESITDQDIEKYLGKQVQKKIYKYADLENYTFNKLLPNTRDYIIILIEEEIDKGHWCVLTKDSKSKEVTWFDPYGIRPGGELSFNTTTKNKQLGNEQYDISKILNEAYDKSYNITYNKKRFQSSDRNVNTCGRHCIFYLLSFIRSKVGLKEYIEYIDNLKSETGMDADHIVAAIII